MPTMHSEGFFVRPLSWAAISPAKSTSPKYGQGNIPGLVIGTGDIKARTDSAKELFRWEERQELGSGAFATVYRATCAIPSEQGAALCRGRLKPTHDYAVKTLPRDFLKAGSRNHKNFLHEVMILYHINHPSCIKLYDVFEDPEIDRVCLCLEYVKGGELLDVLNDHVAQGGCLTESEARRIVSQLLEVLAYLHENEIVHRDIKPENIMTDPVTLSIKIVDFGFAKFFGHDAPRGMEDMVVASPVAMTPLGTFRYMAPEVLNAITVMDEKAHLRAREQIQKLDVFALGVVAYLTLGGSHPFPALSFADLPELIAEGPPFDDFQFEHISPRAKDFCLQLMHYDSEARPTAKEAMRHAWFHGPLDHSSDGSISVKVHNSSGCLLAWLRDQSETAGPSPRSQRKTPKSPSPVAQKRPWALAHRASLGDSPSPSPAGDGAAPNGKTLNWADLSCSLDLFGSHTSSERQLCPDTPRMLLVEVPAGAPTETRPPMRWADMSCSWAPSSDGSWDTPQADPLDKAPIEGCPPRAVEGGVPAKRWGDMSCSLSDLGPTDSWESPAAVHPTFVTETTEASSADATPVSESPPLSINAFSQTGGMSCESMSLGSSPDSAISDPPAPNGISTQPSEDWANMSCGSDAFWTKQGRS